MEAKAQAIARNIIRQLGDAKVGFCVILADFGNDPERHFTYISNGKREAMLALLKEAIEKIEKGNGI